MADTRRRTMFRTVFTRARWAVVVAVLLALGAMLRYPGGTPLDHSTEGYSLSRNFLSDLGMTVAYDGRPNVLGAAMFVASLGILVLAFGACLVGFVRRYSEAPRARRFARAAGALGLVVCAAFVGVAVTPENRVMGLHVGFTLFAWRAFPIPAVLLALASLYAGAPRRVTMAWGILTAALVAYVVVLGWGPAVRAPGGLAVQVVAQKLMAVTAVAVLLYLGVEADRAAVGTTR